MFTQSPPTSQSLAQHLPACSLQPVRCRPEPRHQGYSIKHNNSIHCCISLLLFVHAVPPRITAGFQQVNASLDQPVLLDCQASGTQPLEWTWRKDGLPFQQREGVAYATSGLQSTLSISMVTENDGGVYQCVVSQPYTGREANSNNFLKPICKNLT